MADTNTQGISSSSSGVGLPSNTAIGPIKVSRASVRRAARKKYTDARKKYYDTTEALKAEEPSTYQSPSEKRGWRTEAYIQATNHRFFNLPKGYELSNDEIEQIQKNLARDIRKGVDVNSDSYDPAWMKLILQKKIDGALAGTNGSYKTSDHTISDAYNMLTTLMDYNSGTLAVQNTTDGTKISDKDNAQLLTDILSGDFDKVTVENPYVLRSSRKYTYNINDVNKDFTEDNLETIYNTHQNWAKRSLRGSEYDDYMKQVDTIIDNIRNKKQLDFISDDDAVYDNNGNITNAANLADRNFEYLLRLKKPVDNSKKELSVEDTTEAFVNGLVSTYYSGNRNNFESDLGDDPITDLTTRKSNIISIINKIATSKGINLTLNSLATDQDITQALIKLGVTVDDLQAYYQSPTATSSTDNSTADTWIAESNTWNPAWNGQGLTPTNNFTTSFNDSNTRYMEFKDSSGKKHVKRSAFKDGKWVEDSQGVIDVIESDDGFIYKDNKGYLQYVEKNNSNDYPQPIIDYLSKKAGQRAQIKNNEKISIQTGQDVGGARFNDSVSDKRLTKMTLYNKDQNINFTVIYDEDSQTGEAWIKKKKGDNYFWKKVTINKDGDNFKIIDNDTLLITGVKTNNSSITYLTPSNVTGEPTNSSSTDGESTDIQYSYPKNNNSKTVWAMGDNGSPSLFPSIGSVWSSPTMGEVKDWYNKLTNKKDVIQTAIDSMDKINPDYINYNYIKSVYWLYCLAKDDRTITPQLVTNLYTKLEPYLKRNTMKRFISTYKKQGGVIQYAQQGASFLTDEERARAHAQYQQQLQEQAAFKAQLEAQQTAAAQEAPYVTTPPVDSGYRIGGNNDGPLTYNDMATITSGVLDVASMIGGPLGGALGLTAGIIDIANDYSRGARGSELFKSIGINLGLAALAFIPGAAAAKLVKGATKTAAKVAKVASKTDHAADAVKWLAKNAKVPKGKTIASTSDEILTAAKEALKNGDITKETYQVLKSTAKTVKPGTIENATARTALGLYGQNIREAGKMLVTGPAKTIGAGVKKLANLGLNHPNVIRGIAATANVGVGALTSYKMITEDEKGFDINDVRTMSLFVASIVSGRINTKQLKALKATTTDLKAVSKPIKVSISGNKQTMNVDINVTRGMSDKEIKEAALQALEAQKKGANKDVIEKIENIEKASSNKFFDKLNIDWDKNQVKSLNSKGSDVVLRDDFDDIVDGFSNYQKSVVEALKEQNKWLSRSDAEQVFKTDVEAKELLKYVFGLTDKKQLKAFGNQKYNVDDLLKLKANQITPSAKPSAKPSGRSSAKPATSATPAVTPTPPPIVGPNGQLQIPFTKNGKKLEQLKKGGSLSLEDRLILKSLEQHNKQTIAVQKAIRHSLDLLEKQADRAQRGLMAERLLILKGMK